MKSPSQDNVANRPRAAALVLLALSACALVALTIAGPKLHSVLERKIAMTLRARDGLAFYCDFDGAAPRDAVMLSPVICIDAPRVAGPVGFGRRVTAGRKASFISSYSDLRDIHSLATYAMWVAPDAPDERQEILNAASGFSGLRLFIDAGKVVAMIPCGRDVIEATAEWPCPAGQFAHVAVAISEQSVALYLNGEEKDRLELPGPVSLLPRRWALPVAMRFPFHGVVDEMAMWSRVLSPEEIRSVARSRVNLRRSYHPFLDAAEKALGAINRLGACAIRSIDRLSPFRGRPAAMRHDFPMLVLHTTAADERHFVRAHEKSLFNGYRTKKASNLRRVDVVFGGRAASIEVGLDDIYGKRQTCRRPAFLLRGDMPELLGAGGVARLYPPEAHAIVHPYASDVLPLNARYVRLFEDKSFKGVYAIEAFDAPGAAWLARGEINKALYFNGRPKLSDLPPAGMSADMAARAAGKVALSDGNFPWGALELRARRRRHAELRALMGFAGFSNAVAPVEAILGNNAAPMFITEDLDLRAAGEGLSWTSSDDSVISPDGGVTRPAGTRHSIVTLKAENPATGASQEYRMRVMGQERTLPTFFISICDLPRKEWRQDFTATFVPCDGSPPTRFRGLVGDGGGLRHRGNSAYVTGVKRSMNLKFQEPFAWPDSDRPARRILLCSGRADATRLKNKFAFDSFSAAFGNPDIPATRFNHCEVFINGEWMGVWEACLGVRDLFPEDALIYKVRGGNNYLWGRSNTDILDCVNHPEEFSSDPYSPVADLFKFTSSAPDDVFAREVGSRFILDNLIGYYLVINATCNGDGVFVNQYLAKRKDEGRFLLMPWDCDEILRSSGKMWTNHLFSRLFSCYPDFQSIVAARWRALRAGPLSDDAVSSRIEQDAARLAPYMDEEWRLLKPVGFDGSFAEAITDLRERIETQFSLMDDVFK